MTEGKDDALTLLSIGALVSIVASLAHEVVGHGLGCLLGDGRITLITFLVFRCAGAGTLADAGGPVGVLVMGSLALAFAWALRRGSSLRRLFLLNLGATALLWACGQAISEAIDGSDDWGHVAANLGWSDEWHWMLGTAGVLGYAATLWGVGRLSAVFADGRSGRLLLPYAAGAASAILLGALWHGDRLASALDGFLSFGVAPAGYLLVARGIALWLIFGLTVARGLGPLA